MARMSFTCPACGHTVTAESEPELIRKMQEHAQQAHGMTMSEDQARRQIEASRIGRNP